MPSHLGSVSRCFRDDEQKHRCDVRGNASGTYERTGPKRGIQPFGINAELMRCSRYKCGGCPIFAFRKNRDQRLVGESEAAHTAHEFYDKPAVEISALA
jgi:hypothetical protein